MASFRLLLVLGLGLIFWLWDLVDGPPPSFPTSGYEVTDSYREWRGDALEVRQGRSTAAAEEPLAVLMEVGVTEGVVTLKAGRGGTVSAYTSTARRWRSIRTAEVPALTEAFRLEAVRSANWMRSTTEYPLPESGQVRFYIVRADGVRTTQVAMDALEGGGNALSRLYRAGADLALAIHEAD
ncbi:MAG TPA: hypothetical protein VHG51_04880 [Longimicrobiaceae bacterium]|nr:hypothetical protein [Longimicrobiaceae bacterium]